ncbi:hypothetical protein IWZ01DRAFT_512297 [Phyllosticta capitalensis]
MSKRWEKKGVFCWMDGLMDHDGDGHAASQTLFSARTLFLLSAFSLFLVAWSIQQLVVDGCLHQDTQNPLSPSLPSLPATLPLSWPSITTISPTAQFILLFFLLIYFFFLPFFVTPPLITRCSVV